MNRNKFTFVHFLLIAALMFFLLINSSCQNSSKKSGNLNINRKSTSGYFNPNWLKGLNLSPNNSINQKEIYRQYVIKNTWWDEAFNFLKTHDLKTLAPGKYTIDSGNVFATVWEGVPKIKDSVLWEAHRNFNDLQYIITGRAEMGITSIADPNKKITIPYSKEQDIEHFSVVTGDKYYPADSNTFFIFSPTEIHRPAIQMDGSKSIKKIIIKVRVPQ